MFALIVMAAGVGSRYGGIKQLAPVGPNGEAFLDFAIAGAVKAGADKVIIVTRSEIESHIRHHIDIHKNSPTLRHTDNHDIKIAYVRQDAHGPQRAKPWGTAHAVLVAASQVSGDFMVCNADDYYGPSSFIKLSKAMANHKTQPHQQNQQTITSQHTMQPANTINTMKSVAFLCGYHLGFTLPDHGSVNRGVCEVRDGRLTAIVEHHGVTRSVDGNIVAATSQGTLADDALVSMNLWALPQATFSWLDDGFSHFLKDHRNDPSIEYLLPHLVTSKIAEGSLTVKIVTAKEQWIGITHPEDLDKARTIIARYYAQ